MFDSIIGLHVRYFDILQLERFGTIVYAEPYTNDIAYVYIEDEDLEFNIHMDILNGKEVRYAEIRLSTEVYLDTND